MAKKTETPDVVAQLEAQIASEARAPESALSPEARELAAALAPSKPEAKPDISRLPDALDGEGAPLFSVGDRIVIERRAHFLEGNPYLDTRTYKVKGIDEGTGVLSLWDESLSQWACDNFVAGPITGQVYKLAVGRTVSTKRKRGRPRKNPVEAPTTPAPSGPKKRGRPPGSKNRSKDVIAAEKAAKLAQRRGKKKGAKR